MSRALLGIFFALVCLLEGCRSCSSPAAVVATLAARQGNTTRELATAPGAWGDVQVGGTFGAGDAVRTVAASTAKVTLVSGGALNLREKTTVRFLAKGSKVRRVGIETGEAEIEAGDTALGIETSVGLAQMEPGTVVHLSSDGKDLRFEVLLGRAEFDEDGGPVSVAAGQRFLVSLGVAKLEPIDAVDAGAPIDAAASDADVAMIEIAEAEVRGPGVQAAPPGGALAPLAVGTAKLADGSRLVVPKGSSVELTRGDERASLIGRTEVVIGSAGEALVKVRAGRILLKSRGSGKRIDVPGGSIVLAQAGTGDVQAEIEVENQNAHVVTNQSQISLRGTQGTAALGPGQSGTLDGKGRPTTEETALAFADVTIDASESPIIHSPRGTAAVGVRFPACPADAIMQVTSGGATRRMFARGEGTSRAVVSLPVGYHTYSVRCVGSTDDRADRDGAITVLRDAGAARVVRTAPANTIDADGRHYSILYQNLLPKMTFRWPHAPEGGIGTLHLTHAGAPEQKFPVTQGSITLPQGAVREGSYGAWFQADGPPPLRTPETTVKVTFDNAAPAAEIQQPTDGQPLASTVHVAGVAAEGSTVTVAGTIVPMDPQSRFEGDVPGPASGEHAIAVRISHPAHGIHYYLRMSSGGAP